MPDPGRCKNYIAVSTNFTVEKVTSTVALRGYAVEEADNIIVPCKLRRLRRATNVVVLCNYAVSDIVVLCNYAGANVAVLCNYPVTNVVVLCNYAVTDVVAHGRMHFLVVFLWETTSTADICWWCGTFGVTGTLDREADGGAWNDPAPRVVSCCIHDVLLCRHQDRTEAQRRPRTGMGRRGASRWW